MIIQTINMFVNKLKNLSRHLVRYSCTSNITILDKVKPLHKSFFPHSMKPLVADIISRPSTRIQYVSDVHVDTHKNIPLFKDPMSDVLALCGDIGNPKHNNVKKFLDHTSHNFDKIFLVLGNHDIDCGNLFKKIKYDEYFILWKDLCSKYDNIILLNNNVYRENKIIYIGTTLWTNPLTTKLDDYNNPKFIEHVSEFKKNFDWLKNMVTLYNADKIVILSHFPPTHKLKDIKYENHDLIKSSWYYNNLDDFIINNPQISAWLCGHSHSTMECVLGNTFCGLNAYGYPEEKPSSFNIITNKFVPV